MNEERGSRVRLLLYSEFCIPLLTPLLHVSPVVLQPFGAADPSGCRYPRFIDLRSGLDPDPSVGRQVGLVQPRPDPECDGQLRRPVGKLAARTRKAASLAHRVDPLDRFDGADKDSPSPTHLPGHDIEAVMHAVYEVDIGVS